MRGVVLQREAIPSPLAVVGYVLVGLTQQEDGPFLLIKLPQLRSREFGGAPATAQDHPQHKERRHNYLPHPNLSSPQNAPQCLGGALFGLLCAEEALPE